ncbi:DUF4854 domain-containing protein [Ruminococcaceae bacterium OttesenSCG-928-L11]|nr:DUF4854 domain-containing protein [Ruminococcaceae bacterium OttesenSCG-928-L11]
MKMKKISLSLLACVMLAIALAVTGCSGNNSLQAMVDQMQDQIPQLEEQFGDTMKIEIMAEENTLIYRYTFKEDVGDADAVAEGLEAGMAAESATFETIAQQLRTAGVKDASVKIQYFNADGSSLYETEFK